ncbi:MAG: class I SAM-dependent methyltransferase [Magnetococcales bacterium]|nr:class I SAM-dependent methyltransferase [Magnetococcales bacterium]
MNCRLCGGTEAVLFSKEQRDHRPFTLVHCRTCQVIQTLEQYEAVSPDYLTLADGSIDQHRLWCQADHKEPAFRQWQRITQPRWPDGPRHLLDVGCGTGGFLAYAARQGWQVFGFDASSAQADHARQRFPQVRHATSCQAYLAQLSAAAPPFAMITLWDVFEHIRAPQTFLQALSATLSTNGLLFLSIPNGKALHWKRWLYRMTGKPLSLDPWEHVFYYSGQALQRWLPEWGFQVETIGSMVCYPRPLSLFELVRRTGFALLNRTPSLAPQIYCLARKSDAGLAP